MKKYWFKRKTYGWGWTPATWEGWLTIVLWAVAFVIFLTISNKNATSDSQVVFTFVIPILVMSFILILISWLKGETPRWQWGEPKKKKR